MRVDPAIAALRRDRARQRRAQEAMAAASARWRATPGCAHVLADFERYAGGAPLRQCAALQDVFGDRESAPRLVAALTRALCAALARDPFGHPPFRHGSDRGTATLLLAGRGTAQLVLLACEPGRRSFDVVTFSDGERGEAVLAGEASARLVHRRDGNGRLTARPLALGPGARLALDLREQALQVLAIERRLVLLRLQRSARDPGPAREYDLSSGAVLRQAAGDIRTSRHEMMLALLGRMRCAEAAPVMAAIAREPGDASLRWQALRECLALDTAAGFAALGELAGAMQDPLAPSARALHAQLLAAHPDLAALPVAACLA